jgi:small-conductance mechanosensitive channel
VEALRNFWTYPLITYGDGEAILVSQLVLVLFVLGAGFLLSKLIEKLIQRRLAKTDIRPDAAHMLQRIVFYLLLVVLVMTALGLMNVPLTAFAFVSGAVAIGVGFGAQNVINNFISGWILLVERPVRIDDFVEVDAHKGVVERIGNRSTRVRRTDGVHLLIPNSQMLERVVVNWTLVDHEIRTSVQVGVAYGSPLKKVAELVLRSVTEHPEVMREPAPRVFLEDFADNAILFDATFWCEVDGERELRQVRSTIRFRIAELFDENGIVIAFPQRDVHLDSLTPLQVQVLETSPKGIDG